MQAQVAWVPRTRRSEPSAIDLARTSTDPDKRPESFEHDAGCRERGVTSGTDWAEMRIAKSA